MIILPNKGLAFISVTKCGSTSVEAAMQEYKGIFIGGTTGLKHTKYRHIEEFVLPFLDTKKIKRPHFFAVTREPADRLMSWYKFRQRDQLANAPTDSKKKLNFIHGISFEEFAEAVLTREKGPMFSVDTQRSFVEDANGDVKVDTLIRLESLNVIFPKLLRKFKIRPPESFERKNISPKDKESEISDELRDRINKSSRFKQDFLLYRNSIRRPKQLLQEIASKEA